MCVFIVPPEVQEALKLKKPIILIHELDERHGKYDFNT